MNMGNQAMLQGTIHIEVIPDEENEGVTIAVDTKIIHCDMIDKYRLCTTLLEALKSDLDEMLMIHMMLGPKLKADRTRLKVQ